MRCSVTGCRNDSRYSSKLQGITFHLFPLEPSLRSAWLQAIGREDWQPKEGSTVCSEHFHCDDLYDTRKGLRRKVRPGAVPAVFQDSEYDAASVKVCRICLATGCKLLSMKKYKLEQAYLDLTGVLPYIDDRLPQSLCVECAQRLASCQLLRKRSLRANTLLAELLREQDRVTVKTVKVINRKDNQLVSRLAPKVFSPDQYYLTLNHDDVVNQKSTEESVTNAEPEIKDENDCNEIFISEFDDTECNVADNDIDGASDKAFDDDDDDNEFEVTNDDDDKFEVTNDVNDKELEIKNEDDEFDEPKDGDDLAASDSSTDEDLPRGVLRSRLQKRRGKEGKGQKKGKKCKDKKPEQPKVDRRRKPFFNDEDLRETLFTITDLTYDEQVAEIDKRKESSNYKNGVYKCQECYKGFLDEDAYNSHMARHTNESGEYRCHICKTHFKHPHALRKHITAHHTQRFSCKQCPYATTHRQSARLHERWHKGTKYTCPHCPDEFVKFTTYMGHIRIKHPSDFVCQLCGFSFVSEKGILLHKRLKHRQDVQIPEDGPFCELCNLRFIDPEALRRHISVSARHNTLDKSKRAPNKPTKGRRGRDQRGRERRARDAGEEDAECAVAGRRAEGPIPCEQCGMQLVDSRAYHGHFRRMHPDKNRTNYPSMKSPCMCEVCGRMFQSYTHLKDHRWVHTGERPFSCDACGKSFRMKQRLVAHRRVHSAEKATYACALCGKHFSTHSNRQRHMFIHTGLKPFKCEMCGKGFKHASEKRAHVTYVHLKKPWPKRSRGKRRQQVPMPPPPAQDVSLQPLWPPCEPKPLAHDKPPYYALKM